MKKLFILIATVMLVASVFAQAPQKMSYQAVIRNSSDVLVTNTQVGMEISIRQGSQTGTVVYTETQTPTTNANGLVSIEIGGGTGFNTIDWAIDTYYIETKTDPTGGTTYTITGTSQLLSVPYALHAKTAESVSGTITETDPVFTAWDKTTGISITESQISDLDHFTTADEADPIYGASVASGITGTDTTNWNNKLDSETDPVFTAWDKTTGISITESQISDLDHFTTADETDPIYGASVASGITGTDTTNWNNKLDSETDPVFTAWDKTTGISITESQISDLDHFTTADETDPIYGASVASGITGTDTTNWNNKLDSETDPVFTAWDKTTGISITESQISDLDHFTTADETDPIYGASVASGITGTDTTNWNNKLDSETDPVFTAWDKTTGISITESQISDLDHFTTADETDPIYGASVASGITGTDTTNWNNKLDSETDPVFTAWDKTTGISITESQISDLDHFTTADETDPIYGASVASGITGTDTTNWNNKLDSETDPVFTAWDKTTGISITESQISDLDHFTTADETDPIYGASVASGITGTDTTNWNNKLDSETDPVFTAWDKTTGISITESQISDLDHFTTADETDPIYGASVASGITGTDTTNWNNKLDSETDPVFTAWDKTTGISITESQISDLDHFTTADETDPIYGASVASGITGTDTTNWNNKLDSETDPVFTAWDKDYADLINIPAAADGSETKVTAGTNVTITGAGTTASPYVVNSTAGGSTLAIGDSYQGGIIFWLDATGQHGLIAATTDQSTGIEWYNGTYTTTNAVRDGIGAGMYNTERIIANQSTGSYAAQLCANYQGGGYGDWYLPSKYELNLLYQQRTAVGGFASAYYWSSTEYDNGIAWGQSFVIGYQSYSSKDDTDRVRAVRAF